MANYQVNTTQATTPALQAMSATYKTDIEILAQTTGLKRTMWYAYKVGAAGAPASTDTYIEWDISRITATGTGTAATPNPVDSSGDSAASAACKINNTAEGTYTANLQQDYGTMNQRGMWGWQTNDVSQMLKGPATNNAGLGLRMRSGGFTGNPGATVFFNE